MKRPFPISVVCEPHENWWSSTDRPRQRLADAKRLHLCCSKHGTVLDCSNFDHVPTAGSQGQRGRETAVDGTNDTVCHSPGSGPSIDLPVMRTLISSASVIVWPLTKSSSHSNVGKPDRDAANRAAAWVRRLVVLRASSFTPFGFGTWPTEIVTLFSSLGLSDTSHTWCGPSQGPHNLSQPRICNFASPDTRVTSFNSLFMGAAKAAPFAWVPRRPPWQTR